MIFNIQMVYFPRVGNPLGNRRVRLCPKLTNRHVDLGQYMCYVRHVFHHQESNLGVRGKFDMSLLFICVYS